MPAAERFPYQISSHAAVEIVRRKIALTWIVRVLENPQRTEKDRRDPALWHALGRVPEFGGRVLRVVYNPQRSPWRIVTVYFDRNAQVLE